MAIALVLSGGATRGDFEAGAVKFLYEVGIRPDIICSTSVGSVNAIKLAEGEGAPTQGLAGLLNGPSYLFVSSARQAISNNRCIIQMAFPKSISSLKGQAFDEQQATGTLFVRYPPMSSQVSQTPLA